MQTIPGRNTLKGPSEVEQSNHWQLQPNSPALVLFLGTKREGFLAYWGWWTTVVLPAPQPKLVQSFVDQFRTAPQPKVSPMLNLYTLAAHEPVVMYVYGTGKGYAAYSVYWWTVVLPHESKLSKSERRRYCIEYALNLGISV